RGSGRTLARAGAAWRADDARSQCHRSGSQALPHADDRAWPPRCHIGRGGMRALMIPLALWGPDPGLRVAEARGAEARGAEARGAEARGAEARGAEARGAEAPGAEEPGAEATEAEAQSAGATEAEAQSAEAQS